MRGNRKVPDLANILPSVRARGILVPLIVREKREEAGNSGKDCPSYEIVAGKRRYHAALTLAQENDGIDPLPCAVMEASDDAAAFHGWEHERTPRRKGGRVYVAIGHRGDVTFHEGYRTNREAEKARRKEQGEAMEKPSRPEISSAVQSYIDLHRHAAVRAVLADVTSVALRVMLAHAIAGSPLWRVDVERQRAHHDAIAESVETSSSEAAFDVRRRRVLALLDFDPETPAVTGGDAGDAGDHGLSGLVVKLLTLSDDDVCAIIVMGETLEAGSALIELLGLHLGVDMARCWQADDALLDAIRDREIIGHLLAEVAGPEVAAAHAGATARVQRGILRDCLMGSNGRVRVEGWVPGWMTFPPRAYTIRGVVGSVSRAERIAPLLATPTDAEPACEAA